MSVEFIGFIGTRDFSETRPATGPIIDRPYIEKLAKAHEDGGFDRALIAFHSVSPDSTLIAAYAGFVTERLGLMIAHRPGFIAPTVAARQFTTLDQLVGGRVAAHIITGGDDEELSQDGSFIGKDERYARTDEYLDVLKAEWTSEKPFDYEGRFYRFEKAFSTVKSTYQPRIPLYFGGSSEAAIAVAGKHADIYALWGETHAQVRETIARVRAAAAKHGRDVRFSLSLRPILADTEEKAWARADAILERAKEVQSITGYARTKEPQNVGAQRLLAAAAQGSRLDKRLWTGVAELTGAKGNTTSLVGTPEQVADALRDYYDLGVTTFLIRGFDPLDDAIQYGRELLPATRDLITRTRTHAGVAAE